MSSSWRPDDRFLDKKDGGQEAIRRIRKALTDHGFDIGQILTSRDEGMDRVIADLERTDLPPGVRQWYLPVAIGGTFAFHTVAEPDAKIPEHSHDANLFRFFVSGTALYRDDIKLSAGDWMLVPKGQRYSLRAASNPGFTTDHMYW